MTPRPPNTAYMWVKAPVSPTHSCTLIATLSYISQTIMLIGMLPIKLDKMYDACHRGQN